MTALPDMDPIPPQPVRGGRVVVAPPRPAGSNRMQPRESAAAQNRRRLPAVARTTQSVAELRTAVAALEPDVPAATSPVASIRRVLIALFTCALLSLVVDAQGLVHSGEGMPDGTERTITLDIGNAALAVGNFTHLNWVWNQLAAAHGYHPQTSAPLLASGPPDNSPPPRTGGPGRGSGRNHAPPPAPRVVVAPTRRPTARNPLRLLATGDSLTEFMGPALLEDASSAGPIRGFVDTHYGTGIVRPDYVDWSVVAQQQVRSDHPEAVVVMLGGNDNQNMVVAGGRILDAGTPTWTREYQRRAAICMRIWTQNGKHRVYWLSMPPARDADWTHTNMQIDVALRAAARQVPGAEYLNILGRVTDHGRYADFVNVGGVPTLVREPDGIHFNAAGSAIIAREVLAVLEREWHFGH